MWTLLGVALAGSLDGEVALDVFAATSRSEGPGTGPSETLAAAELGTRVRMTALESDDRLQFRLDYRGRQPVAGNIRNDALHLVYRLEARYAIVEDRFEAGVGRFLAPTPIFLPVDGANVLVRAGAFEVSAFGGRRAISTSRRNLAPGELLPAVGAALRWSGDRHDLRGSLAWSQDSVAVAAGGEAIEEPLGGLSGLIVGSARPTDRVSVGGQIGMIQQATYALGPTWTEATIEATALGLFNGLAWTSLEPAPWMRIDLDALHQEVQAWSVGIVQDGAPTADVQEPRFTDLRARVRVGPPAVGWIRQSVRLRLRPDRTEVRAQIQLDVHDFGVPGPYLSVRGAFDDISGEDQKDDVGARDRTFGAASVGWRKAGLDAQLGASYVERAATPVSGRRVDPGDPGQPATSEDLQPFTLEADPILFARGFYSGKRWFVGADLEKNMKDEEFRAMVQIGVLAEVGW